MFRPAQRWQRVAVSLILFVSSDVYVAMRSTPTIATSSPQLTISCSASSVTPSPVTPGNSAHFQVTVTAASNDTGLNATFDVFAPGGNRIYNVAQHNVAFSANAARTLTAQWTVPTTQSPGTYLLRFGVFTSSWGASGGYKTCTSFTVGPGATAVSTATPTSAPQPTNTAQPTSTPAGTQGAATGAVYYVSKNGSNADGRSWATAWNELDQINWSAIQPGATIELDGGTTAMTYTTTLAVGAQGTAAQPITIKLATEAGHNGQAILFGGRYTPLPYCAEPSSSWHPTMGPQPTWRGIDLSGASHVRIDGTKWRGIVIHGESPTTAHPYGGYGVNMSSTSTDDTLTYMEIYDNGEIRTSSSGAAVPANTVAPDHPGIWLKGSNLVFDHLIMHDNGQDQFQSDGLSGHVTVSYTWMYNSRQNPLAPHGVPFNHPCTHQDGMQIYNGGTQTAGLGFDHDVFGPGLMQGTILADTNATVENVAFSNDLFDNAMSNAAMGSPPSTANWRFDHITSFQTPTNALGNGASSFYLAGSGFAVSNSVVYGGNVHLPTGTSGSGNCAYATSGNTSALTGQTIDPRFATNVGSYADTTSLDQLMQTDYTLQAASPCAGKGSSITSAAQLLNQ